jgi:hypothetical protein
MKRKSAYWSYGLISFCEAKQLNLNEVVNAFIKEYKLTGDKDDAVANNWQKFAGYVNKGLLNGTIKGRQVSVSNGSQEQKQANREAYATVSEDLRKWWQYMTSKGYNFATGIDGFLIAFFNAYGIGTSLPKKEVGDLQILKNKSRYDVIVEAGLLNEFYTFDPKLISKFKPAKV